MSVRTHEPLTHAVCRLAFLGPATHAEQARQVLSTLGFTEARETIPWREALPSMPDAERPGRMLRAARRKEGVTQLQLAQMSAIPQRHINENALALLVHKLHSAHDVG